MSAAWWLAVVVSVGQVAHSEMPRVTDPRLELVEFAQQPDIVTPVGIDVDRRGRVFVVESHTHFPPPNYAGPKGDRIRLLVDTNQDGKADSIETFAEGLRHTMNLAIYHDDSLFVATRSEILRMRDTNDDGRADERVRIAHLETKGDYPHNGLSGFAFDLAGNVYFGFGENLGADYTLIGSDGARLPGGGEGGNIYRCRPDGSRLERIATGFWNPFHLAIDAFGRLFAVDNDPDSRPPCRLLHIVPDGDYGYRFRNGRRGTHPFTAWNGELPGTLPMVAGTGEAPSGIVAYESDNWPAEYLGKLLVTSWGDHRIDAFALKPRGASFASTAEPVVVGGENFRPVGIAVAPDGSVYFSDWVDKSYQLHGKGRVWKLSAKTAAQRTPPANSVAALSSVDRATRESAARTLAKQGPEGIAQLRSALSHAQPRTRALAASAILANPANRESKATFDALEAQLDRETDVAVKSLFVRLAGEALGRPSMVDPKQPGELRAAALESMDLDLEWFDALEQAADDVDPFIQHFALRTVQEIAPDPKDWNAKEPPRLRQAMALQLRRHNSQATRTAIPKLLADDDPWVRFIGVQWIGEDRLKDFRPQVDNLLATRANTRTLFEACLVTLELLDGRQRNPTDEWRGDQYVAQLLTSNKASAAARRQALRSLRPDHPTLTLPLLKSLLADQDASVRLEAIRTLRESPHAARLDELTAMAADAKREPLERAEAIVGLRGDQEELRGQLLEWALRGPNAVAQESLRSLRGAPLSDMQRRQLADAKEAQPTEWRELVAVVLDGRFPASPPAESLAAWIERLEGQGSAEAGQRIFFHGKSVACARCHEIDGRGGLAGPDLTPVGRTFSPARLVESIVQPSREVAPHFVPWVIASHDGQVRTGLLVGEEVDGTQRYVDEQGREFRLKPQDIDERRLATKSIMPDGLAGQLTLQEFRDLLAYLREAR